jgi:hypothetical protein
MKKQIKNILPFWFVEYIKLKRKSNFYKNKPLKETFTHIKENQVWNNAESVSGTGSELEATQELIKELELLFEQYNISSLLDIPCGDFNWMQHVNLKNIDYIGGDIVQSLVDNNIHIYGNEKKTFQLLDLTKDDLQKVDVVLCRDCLVHLSYKDIYKALVNIKKSKSKYVLMTSFSRCLKNKNIFTGQWRKLNFELFPFYLNKPVMVIDEKYTKRGVQHSDKIMALWEVSDISIPFQLKLYNWFT